MSATPSRSNPGRTCATVVSSDSLPSSMSCMIIVAVHGLVIDPIWNSESGVTGTPVAVLSTPVAASCCCPSAQMASVAPWTWVALASSASRPAQCAVASSLVMARTLAHRPWAGSSSGRENQAPGNALNQQQEKPLVGESIAAGLDQSAGSLELRADCGRCFGLCCVAPAFVRSADFAIDKPAGQPCPNLATTSFDCSLHD